jgi:hypothetical protein
VLYRRAALYATLVGGVLLAALAGCGGESAGGGQSIACQAVVTCPQYHPEIANRTDNFEFQVTDITQVTQTLQYTWHNTGTQANINQASQLSAGIARVVLRDATGKSVYSADLQANGTFMSTTGEAGNWAIEVELTTVSGTLNFRVQKGE